MKKFIISIVLIITLIFLVFTIKNVNVVIANDETEEQNATSAIESLSESQIE